MKYHWQAPFDKLENVTKLIKLYKENVSYPEMMFYFGTTENVIRNTLRYHNVPSREKNLRMKARAELEVLKEKPVVGKYDHLIFEPINAGKEYKQILKDKGIKIPKEGNFTRMHKYKLNSQPWRLKKKTPN